MNVHSMPKLTVIMMIATNVVVSVTTSVHKLFRRVFFVAQYKLTIPEVKYIKQYPTCDGRCQYAINEKCICQCNGKYHGYIYRGHRRNLGHNVLQGTDSRAQTCYSESVGGITQ